MNELIKYLLGLVSLKGKELGLDWRSSWSRITSPADDQIDIELSRGELVDIVASSIERFKPVSSTDQKIVLTDDSGKTINVILAGKGDKNLLWATSSVVDMRREPQHSSELINQAIMGEAMTGLENRGDWHFVRMEDDYHGWVRSWSVTEAPRSEIEDHFRKANARVEINVGYLLSSTDPGRIPVTDLVSGTFVEVLSENGGFSNIRVPGGKSGYFPSESLGVPGEGRPDRQDIIARAEKFLGIPYIWGGTSAKGFDCSGLVKRVYMMEGVSLPRDADQQSSVGKMIALDKIDTVLPADLLYFADGDKITHVAIALGKGRFLHSFGDVRINSYWKDDDLYEEKLAEKLVFARSVLP